MSSSRNRLLLAAAAIVVLIVAFIALQPGDDPEPAAAPVTAAATTPVEPVASTPADTAPAPKPAVTYVTLQSGKIAKIKVKQGDVVRVQVTSPKAEELHIHGYDIAKDLPAGQLEKVAFTAKLAGIFEMEYEGAGEQLAELTVEPK
jgi:FtsP/CotA-like multicopper oxidase with cupredoxin domain